MYRRKKNLISTTWDDVEWRSMNCAFKHEIILANSWTLILTCLTIKDIIVFYYFIINHITLPNTLFFTLNLMDKNTSKTCQELKFLSYHKPQTTQPSMTNNFVYLATIWWRVKAFQIDFLQSKLNIASASEKYEIRVCSSVCNNAVSV